MKRVSVTSWHSSVSLSDSSSIVRGALVFSFPRGNRPAVKWLNTGWLFLVPSPSASRTMSKPTGGGANDVTRFLTSGAGPGSPTSNSAFSAASQADWAAKRLVWVPSEKQGFEVSWWKWMRCGLVYNWKQTGSWKLDGLQLFHLLPFTFLFHTMSIDSLVNN